MTIRSLQFEAVKVRMSQTKEGHVFTMAIHPNDTPEELMRHPVGSRYQAVLVRLNDDDTPADQGLPTGNKATAVGQVASGGATEISRAEKTPQQKAVARCAILCEDPAFMDWLCRREKIARPTGRASAEIVRTTLQCQSRRDIAADPNVFDRWLKLVGDYDDHVRYGDRR